MTDRQAKKDNGLSRRLTEDCTRCAPLYLLLAEIFPLRKFHLVPHDFDAFLRVHCQVRSVDARHISLRDLRRTEDGSATRKSDHADRSVPGRIHREHTSSLRFCHRPHGLSSSTSSSSLESSSTPSGSAKGLPVPSATPGWPRIMTRGAGK